MTSVSSTLDTEGSEAATTAGPSTSSTLASFLPPDQSPVFSNMKTSAVSDGFYPNYHRPFTASAFISQDWTRTQAPQVQPCPKTRPLLGEDVRLPPSHFGWGKDIFHITDSHLKDTVGIIYLHDKTHDYYQDSVPMPLEHDTPAQDMEDILENMGSADAYKDEYHEIGPVTPRKITTAKSEVSIMLTPMINHRTTLRRPSPAPKSPTAPGPSPNARIPSWILEPGTTDETTDVNEDQYHIHKALVTRLEVDNDEESDGRDNQFTKQDDIGIATEPLQFAEIQVDSTDRERSPLGSTASVPSEAIRTPDLEIGNVAHDNNHGSPLSSPPTNISTPVGEAIAGIAIASPSVISVDAEKEGQPVSTAAVISDNDGDIQTLPASQVFIDNEESKSIRSGEDSPHRSSLMKSSLRPAFKRAQSADSALLSIRVDVKKYPLNVPVKLFDLLDQDKYRYVPPVTPPRRPVEIEVENIDETIGQETTVSSLEQQIQSKDDKAGILDAVNTANVPLPAPHLRYWHQHPSDTPRGSAGSKTTAVSSAQANTVGNRKRVRDSEISSSSRSKTSKSGRKPGIRFDKDLSKVSSGPPVRFPSKWLTATAYSIPNGGSADHRSQTSRHFGETLEASRPTSIISSAVQNSAVCRYDTPFGSEASWPARIVHSPDPIDFLDCHPSYHDKEEETVDEGMVDTDIENDITMEGEDGETSGLGFHTANMTNNTGVRYGKEELEIIRTYYVPGEPISDALVRFIQEVLRENGYARTKISIEQKLKAMPRARKGPLRH